MLSPSSILTTIHKRRFGLFPKIKRLWQLILPAVVLLSSTDWNGKCQTLFFITTTVCLCRSAKWGRNFFTDFPVTPYNTGNGDLAKNGRKKSSKSFQTYCLCAALVGGGIQFFMIKEGGSTLCCRPLITHLRNRAGLSTAGVARSSWPLTAPAGFAISCYFFISYIFSCNIPGNNIENYS